MGRNFIIKWRPISHDKMNHLVKNYVTINELIDKFYEKLILVMLSVNNASV